MWHVDHLALDAERRLHLLVEAAAEFCSCGCDRCLTQNANKNKKLYYLERNRDIHAGRVLVGHQT